MKKFFYLITITCICIAFVTACSRKTPEAKLVLQDHTDISLAALKGKWILVNYWASWCKVCRMEIPELNTFAQNYSQKVLVFGANSEDLDENVLQKAIENFGITFPVMLQSNLLEYYRIGRLHGIPAILIIDPNGHFFKMLYGKQKAADLAKLLGLS